MPAFLHIDQSLTGRRWAPRSPDAQRLAEGLAQQTGLPPALCAVLAARGVDADGADQFLNPQLRDLMPDPHLFKDMEKAATRFVAAVTGKQRIAIFADYDVDGGASGALLICWLRAFGLQATLYVPDRITEGYGPNTPAMQHLAADHDLIICVDCGTLSYDPIAAVAGQADVIVLDHHMGGETLPDALAVVNPNRQDEANDFTYLCAAGVVFLFLVETNRQLRSAGTAGPDLIGLLDLVALATVADVAPLVGLNCALVRQGLKVMARRDRPGLVALADQARLNTAPSSYHLGFVFGPRINAGGRIGQADLGARLLACDDPAAAAAMAAQLETLNTDRRAVEAAVRTAAIAQAEARGADGPLVWAADDGWHPGVVGIVAARMKEWANRPSIVIGFDGDEGKGSGRSILGVDLGAAIAQLMHEGLIEKGGGHKMAAGLSLRKSQLAPAMDRLAELLARQGADQMGARDLSIDSLLAPAAATPDLLAEVERAGPFGTSAPAPRFAFADMRIGFAKELNGGHLKFAFSDGSGARIDAIAFGAFDGPLGPAIMNHGGALFHLAGRLELNTWNGRQTVQLRLEDAAVAAP